MNWETVQACPMCGDDRATFYGQGHAPIISDPRVLGGASLAVVTTYAVCTACGLIFQAGRLTEQSMSEYYSSGYYRASLGVPQEKIDAQELERGQRIAQYITSGSHLDIGCSRGYLLAETKRKGCKVFGVEPYAEYVTEQVPTCRSLNQVKGLFNNISMIHALEHVYDLRWYARTIISLLAPGGKLIIEVPSDQSPGGPLRLPHVYHFQPPVIHRLFDGLKVELFDMTPHNLFVLRKPL
jgi:SAM-dependent methyltransferase